MWAIAYYPMVVLLGVTLFCIRITDASEVGYRLLLGAFCIGVAVVICVKWVDTRGSTNGSQQPRIWVALSMPLLWMFGIGVAYSMVHHHSMSIVASQLAEWNRLAGANQGTEEERVAGWQPIVVRATLEESLRYRRSSSSYRKSSMDAAGGMDDLASDTAEQWQTLTRLSVHQVRRDGMWFPVSLVGNFVLDEKVQGYYPGDTMEIYGYWRLPPEPSNPGQFDLRKRYAELGVAVQLKAESAAQWELVSRGGSMRIDRWLARLTESSLCLVDRYVILGQAPLTAALVLGQREQADWQLQEELLSTGTIHMLSISGMHIEMVAMSLFVMGVFLRLPQGLVLFGTVVLCVAYAVCCLLSQMDGLAVQQSEYARIGGIGHPDPAHSDCLRSRNAVVVSDCGRFNTHLPNHANQRFATGAVARIEADGWRAHLGALQAVCLGILAQQFLGLFSIGSLGVEFVPHSQPDRRRLESASVATDAGRASFRTGVDSGGLDPSCGLAHGDIVWCIVVDGGATRWGCRCDTAGAFLGSTTTGMVAGRFLRDCLGTGTVARYEARIGAAVVAMVVRSMVCDGYCLRAMHSMEAASFSSNRRRFTCGDMG